MLANQIANGALGAVFARLLAAAAPLLPHAEALLATLSPEGIAVRRVLSTQVGEVDLARPMEQWLLQDAARPSFGPRVPGEEACRSWIRTPVMLGDAVIAILVLFAPPAAEYAASDLIHAEAIARVIMAMGSTGGLGDLFAGVDDDHDLILDPSEEVLRELADVLDVRSIFPRISEIVARVLPHDRLTMTFHDAEGYVGLQVTSDDKPPEFGRVKVAPEVLARPFVLLPELTEEALVDWPPEGRKVLLRSGFRSFLAINLAARTQRMGVEFWSNRFNGFTLADVPLARHIASCLAVAVSHEQLVAASRERAPREDRSGHLENNVGTLIRELTHKPSRHRRIVGESPQWTSVFHAASRVAETDATVLLIGESGTGKEVVARLIHEVSARHRGPFIAVNCAALPEQLLESELFGYERGAFTGATHSKPGQVELAEGGVLFLDEVSEMSLSAQAKFLRILQEREYRRLGGTRVLKADIRVIAATNVDLQRAIQTGDFRRDLYYRLRVFDLKLPPLRERRRDIPLLSEALLDEIAARLGRRRPHLTAAAHAALFHYDWPGNVRELRNVLERASIICDDAMLDVVHLSFDSETFDATPTTDLGEIERATIDRVLRECGGNKSEAAKRLGLSRMQLYVRLRRHPHAAG